MIQSYSSMATFQQCPAKYKFAYIDKVEVQELEPSPALERGSAIHDSIESYFKGGTEFLHPDIHKNYGQFMFGIRENNTDVRPEFKWAVTWEYEPCDYNDPRAMIHGYIDLLVLPEDKNQNIPLYEWKTGGIYKKQHHSQIYTYSVCMMAHFPEYPGVDAMVVYLDKVDYDKVYYPRDMMTYEYKPALRAEIGEIADAKKFPPMPGFKCKWCKFSRYNGGPCPVA